MPHLRSIKNTLVLSALYFCICGTVNAQQKKGWKLIWQDEFNYTGLPDTSKWGYEAGYVRNNEQQYYTNARKENIQVADGFLTIKGIREEYPNAAWQAGSTQWSRKDSLAHYTSASINTQNKFTFNYGRMEVRAKLPAGGGIWPAIWMLGADCSHGGWPMIGEIDVMEFIGNHPNDIYGTIHYATTGGTGHTSSGKHISVPDLHKDFHVYAIEWDDKKIDIFFDDSLYHSFNIDAANTGQYNPFQKPFYILLNLAMGAAWPGPIDDKILPQQFIIDYVRVYQREEKNK
ncbi:glycosyl hydrolase family 16 [Chitinophaga niastensis]|uniref:Glycosyl hydrolase family 16 n=1 Tax=Chitinophaga niastensis TaxID=536980 RepID=A0A2P8HD96_CHINA|nr:glycoside hydrolase family 16 protein [Chitinophaga niastensis]PSL44204.1 glycosyl hydrolase family 16 [Chitinophaga niastensis]